MKVWALMIDDGFDYEPNVAIWDVYSNETKALMAKSQAEIEEPDADFWIEEWEVK